MHSLKKNKKILILGGTGFIGRNLIEFFLRQDQFEIYATYLKSQKFYENDIKWINADLTTQSGIDSVFSHIKQYDVVIQAAASTSGIMDTFNRPDFHVTDNAVMNSLILRAVNQNKIPHFIFFSCTTMLQPNTLPQDENAFDGSIDPVKKYFGVGWTKVFIEKLCNFYSQIGSTRFTVIRHSNVYGPWDRYKQHNSHVCASLITKVLQSNNEIEIWGNGHEMRDLIYIDDLTRLVLMIINKQLEQFSLVNAGGNNLISIKNLATKIIELSRKDLSIKFNQSKPTIDFSVTLDNSKGLHNFGWEPEITLSEGLLKTINFWKEVYKVSESTSF